MGLTSGRGSRDGTRRRTCGGYAGRDGGGQCASASLVNGGQRGYRQSDGCAVPGGYDGQAGHGGADGYGQRAGYAAGRYGQPGGYAGHGRPGSRGDYGRPSAVRDQRLREEEVS
jgi:hypothetical protein